MRKLKLQVQLTLDGYVAGPTGEMDWMNFTQDDALDAYVNALTDSSDTILLGRKMTDGFVNYWTDVVTNQPESRDFAFAKKMVDMPKIVFSKTLHESTWNNTKLANGNLVDEITNLKNQEGKDIIVYGGATFVSALIKHGLIDAYHLCVNPTAIGTGMSIFSQLGQNLQLTLVNATPFACGEVVLHYEPKQA
jgi:dihydrofolate reductase